MILEMWKKFTEESVPEKIEIKLGGDRIGDLRTCKNGNGKYRVEEYVCNSTIYREFSWEFVEGTFCDSLEEATIAKDNYLKRREERRKETTWTPVEKENN